MKIGTLEAKPGEKVSGCLPVEGCSYELPMTIVCGGEGKTLLVTAGVHSAEYVGIQAAIELARELSPEDVKGTVILVPIVNVSGFAHRTMSLVFEDHKNVNREFPGKPDGTICDKICWTLVKELFPKADYYIDLHCGDCYEELYPYVYYVGTAEEKVRDTALKMARQVDVDCIVASDLLTGGAYNYASSMGIPSILIERGGRGLWSREEVELDKQDVRRVMRLLESEEEVRPLREEAVVFHKVVYEYSEFTGCWYAEHRPGDTIRKGELLGVVKDTFGNVLWESRAEADAVLLYQVSSLNVLEDGPMVAYGILEA